MSKEHDNASVGETAAAQDPLTTALQGIFGPVLDVTKRLPAPLAYGLAIAVLIVVLAVLSKAAGALGGPLIWLLGIVVFLVLAAYVFTLWNSRSNAGESKTALFSDVRVNEVFQNLSALAALDRITRDSLLTELRALFDRKTFTEPLRRCPNQVWTDRLDSCYQTVRVLLQFERKVKAIAPDLAARYIELRTEVDRYGMQMGACLFSPEVEYSKIEDHIGKESFKKHLPAEKKFKKLPNGDPDIPDVIADAIEEHRLRCVELKDSLK
jgi:hypothetical protein